MVNNGNSQENRRCLACGEALFGRAGKRFCCEKCRSIYNSSRRVAADEVVTTTIQTVRRNRSLLKRLFRESKIIVKREALEGMGFDVSTFTSIHINRKNEVYYFCCDYGFLPIIRDGTECVLIVFRLPFAKSSDPWNNLGMAL